MIKDAALAYKFPSTYERKVVFLPRPVTFQFIRITSDAFYSIKIGKIDGFLDGGYDDDDWMASLSGIKE
jgi:hypothetical protein